MQLTDLFEDVEHAELGNVVVALRHNPSAALVAVLIKRWNRVRGLTYGNETWVWHAHDATHSQIEEALLVPRRQCFEFMITDDDPVQVLVSDVQWGQSDTLRNMMAAVPSWTLADKRSSSPSTPYWTPYRPK